MNLTAWVTAWLTELMTRWLNKCLAGRPTGQQHLNSWYATCANTVRQAGQSAKRLECSLSLLVCRCSFVIAVRKWSVFRFRVLFLDKRSNLKGHYVRIFALNTQKWTKSIDRMWIIIWPLAVQLTELPSLRQLLFAAVSGNVWDMLPPTCLEYNFDTWPILTALLNASVSALTNCNLPFFAIC